MEPGYIEATHSQSEQVGLPAWSSIHIMASAKGTVPHDQDAAANLFVFNLVNEFLKQKVQEETKKLMIGAGLPDTPASIAIIGDGTVFDWQDGGLLLTFSIRETIGLPKTDDNGPQKVEVLGSKKARSPVGKELEMFNFIAGQLEAQLKPKRDVIIANPRPWVHG